MKKHFKELTDRIISLENQCAVLKKVCVKKSYLLIPNPGWDLALVNSDQFAYQGNTPDGFYEIWIKKDA